MSPFFKVRLLDVPKMRLWEPPLVTESALPGRGVSALLAAARHSRGVRAKREDALLPPEAERGFPETLTPLTLLSAPYRPKPLELRLRMGKDCGETPAPSEA